MTVELREENFTSAFQCELYTATHGSSSLLYHACYSELVRRWQITDFTAMGTGLLYVQSIRLNQLVHEPGSMTVNVCITLLVHRV